MNPRHRRLLIPGLLIALVVVVVVAALTDRADAASRNTSVITTACVMGDERILEQSGLAVSAVHADTAYMINDSGSRAEIFAVDMTDCSVVGVTRLDGLDWRDPEAMTLDGNGTLWIADTGDNLAQRDDAALYSVEEPGRGNGSARPTVHPISYATGPKDVEALLVDPSSGAKWVITKGWLGGELLELPDTLPTDEISVAASTGVSMPTLVTDASMTPDGHYAVVRTYLGATVYDARDDFAAVGDLKLPAQRQGETLAVEPSGESVVVGSEGAHQPVYRVGLDLPDPVDPATPEKQEPRAAPTEEAADGRRAPWIFAGAAAAAVVIFAGAVAATRRRRP